ncbi:hypothetical protein DPMN_043470 [Dreissena polymorpha]|uniref:Uncharacterized protein n=1 Tax=Dreissena polymorpha TaxID=45954 RepID=A0A9D4D2V6_DREPO|nr:hypothetical protein DPMN_043470 [Dreissena polymorpha]
MSMSELARHSPQLFIRYFCRISMSELARISPQLDIRDFCRMAMSQLFRHSSQLDFYGLLPNVDVTAGLTFAPARY